MRSRMRIRRARVPEIAALCGFLTGPPCPALPLWEVRSPRSHLRVRVREGRSYLVRVRTLNLAEVCAGVHSLADSEPWASSAVKVQVGVAAARCSSCGRERRESAENRRRGQMFMSASDSNRQSGSMPSLYPDTRVEARCHECMTFSADVIAYSQLRRLLGRRSSVARNALWQGRHHHLGANGRSRGWRTRISMVRLRPSRA